MINRLESGVMMSRYYSGIAARNALRTFIVIGLILSLTQVSLGYSVLTHEAIVDAAWEMSIKPLLLMRFPDASPEELREAHAYTYGGSIIQDLGYYPFGNKFFSDLAHYVRSGDFVEALVAEAQDINEYAFAIGALEHYAGDNSGHPIAVNRAVPLLYPQLRKKYGAEVTYENSPSAHVKTEFGFDVSQVALGHYAPQSYHDFIGFKVSKPVLERAFKKTYGLELTSVLASVDLALGTFRRSVGTIIPEMTKVAWASKKDEIAGVTPGITRQKFIYNLSRASYEKDWGHEYQKPGFCARVLAFFFRLVPKVGPFKALGYRHLTPEAERLFASSFNSSLEQFRLLLDELRATRLDLKNENFDTGRPTHAGEYGLADKAYAKLLEKLAGSKFADLTPELRANILTYYQDWKMPIKTKKDQDEWQKTLQALEVLKATDHN